MKVELGLKDWILIGGLLMSVGGTIYKVNEYERRIAQLEQQVKEINIPLMNQKIESIEKNVADIKRGMDRMFDLVISNQRNRPSN